MIKLNPDWVNLHVHSVNSLRDGIIRESELVQWAVKNNKKYTAVTNHGSIGGWIEQERDSA